MVKDHQGPYLMQREVEHFHAINVNCMLDKLEAEFKIACECLFLYVVSTYCGIIMVVVDQCLCGFRE